MSSVKLNQKFCQAPIRPATRTTRERYSGNLERRDLGLGAAGSAWTGPLTLPALRTRLDLRGLSRLFD